MPALQKWTTGAACAADHGGRTVITDGRTLKKKDYSHWLPPQSHTTSAFLEKAFPISIEMVGLFLAACAWDLGAPVVNVHPCKMFTKLIHIHVDLCPTRGDAGS